MNEQKAKIMIKTLLLTIVPIIVTFTSGCSEDNKQDPGVSVAGIDFEKQLQQQFLTAKSGDLIAIPAGKFQLSRPLSLKIDGVTVRGQGMDKTILDFSNQVAGAEAILVSANDFTIEDIAIENAKGDALKVNKGNNIIIRRVRTEWTNGPDTNNGAYGIYPVQTTNTLIEGSVAIGASDAGIYVGQSHQVVVRDNRAEFNVAGIEIENTTRADVFNNVARHNTGGILVFNMPDIPKEGHGTRVFSNRIESNNTANFAPEGGAVAGVPAGSGVLVTANDQVEIHDNDIADNQTANIIIASGFSSNLASRETADVYDPYPESIWIHDNRFVGGGDSPDTLELKALKVAIFGVNGRLPDIIWDGFVNPDIAPDGTLPAGSEICVRGEGVRLLNVDAPNEYANPHIDMVSHECTLPSLEPVALEAHQVNKKPE